MFAFLRQRTHVLARLGIVLAALLVLPGQASVFLHLVTSSHTICADHGEAVEVLDACGSQSVAHDDQESPAHSDEHGEHDDHHCTALQLWSQVAGAADAPVLARLEARPTCEAALTAPAARAPRVALWRTAPKNSPPAV